MLLIPIGHDRQVTKRLPIITLTLIALNILIFIFTETVGSQQQARLTSSLKSLIEFTDRNTQLALAEQVKARLARIPTVEIEFLRNTILLEKLASEQPAEKDVLGNPQGIEDPVILTMESQRVGKAFVTAYDDFYAYQYGFIPAYHKSSWLNYISCTFLHAGFLHILGNMLFLFFAGLAVEDAWGRVFFSVFYLLCGFVATATFAYSAPNSRIYLVGASGAMAGVMGAFMVRYFKARIKLFYFVIFKAGTFKAPAYVMLPLWIAFELKDTFFASGAEEGGVAFWAHIGGFFFGAVIGALVHFTGVGKFLAPKNVGRASSFGTGNAIHEAVAHLQEGEHDEAIRKLKQRLDAVPNDEKACLALAKVYGEIGQRTAEIAAYARLIHVLIQKNRLNDALQAYGAVIETYRPDEPPLRLPARDWLLLCQHLASREMLREAVGEYEKLGLAYPGEAVAHEALVRAAELRLQLGEYEYAANIYAFVKTQPLSDPHLYMRIAEGEAQLTNLLRGEDAA